MPGSLVIHYGVPGSGKTLFAMNDVILPAVREHRPFFTNITGISLSALSALTEVHPAFIKYYEVHNIEDVIKYYNDDSLCHDGVFVLDEMKDFIDDKRAIEWLEHCINYMRKQTVDFVMLAQQDAKEYIHPNIVNLCNDSLVFVPRKEQKDEDNVDMYYIRGGHPRIVDGKPVNSVGEEVRPKPVKMYSCYKTSENAFYQGKENKTFRGLVWYRTRKWKFRFVIFGLFFVVLLVVIFTAVGIVGMKDLGTTETQKAGNYEQNNIPARAQYLDQDTLSCFQYILCDEFDCTTDRGVYPAQLYDEDRGLLCGVGPRCLRKCELPLERAQDVPNGGGLLSVGKSVLGNHK
ncbi:MAG: zonular occludens toxin domain-containing protein [Fibrobacter sp.]|nr:zonular occludens toxin domain-containing protein [Fibrobacter sp.]